MANTGYKQATIAFKVDALTGAPLDKNGKLTADSGLKQAVMLLSGATNPNPELYEVVGYFTTGEIVGGVSTRVYDPESCPPQSIKVIPDRYVSLPSGGTYTVVVQSTGPWTVAPNALASLSAYSGPAGYFYLEITPSNTEGQHVFNFILDGSSVSAGHRLIIATDLDAWILDTGFWDNLAFWKATGIWNY